MISDRNIGILGVAVGLAGVGLGVLSLPNWLMPEWLRLVLCIIGIAASVIVASIPLYPRVIIFLWKRYGPLPLLSVYSLARAAGLRDDEHANQFFRLVVDEAAAGRFAVFGEPLVGKRYQMTIPTEHLSNAIIEWQEAATNLFNNGLTEIFDKDRKDERALRYRNIRIDRPVLELIERCKAEGFFAGPVTEGSGAD